MDSMPTFNSMIHPVSASEFFEQYWEKAPLHVARGRPEYFGHLLSLADVDTVLATSSPTVWDVHAVKKSAETPFILSPQQHGRPQPAPSVNRIQAAWQTGHTLIVDYMQRRWGPIARFCAELEQQLNHPVNVNLYLTPPNSQGFSVHYDDHDVVLLMLEGKKTFRLYSPLVELPLAGGPTVIREGDCGQPTHELTLEAGDSLYIPRGVPHEGLTCEEESLHLTVGLMVLRWHELVASALVAHARHDRAFREALPPGFMRGEAGPDVRDRLRELIAAFASTPLRDDYLEPMVVDFIDGRKAPPDGHFVQMRDIARLTIDTPLEKRPGMVCHLGETRTGVSIKFPGNEVSGPPIIREALAFVANEMRFTARDLPGALAEKSRLVLARRLVREGLLRARLDPIAPPLNGGTGTATARSTASAVAQAEGGGG